MTKQITKISALLFVGVFVFTLAFTLVASPAYAAKCCEVWSNGHLVRSGVPIDLSGLGNQWVCRCAPLENPNHCPLICPPPR